MDGECTFAPELGVHDCCVQHDYDYADQMDRKLADRKFFICCSRKSVVVAVVYYIAVRMLGWVAYNKYRRELS